MATPKPTIYKLLYDFVTDWIKMDKNKYKAFYPFQENPVNIKTGYISFFKLPHRMVVSRSESIDSNGVLTVFTTEALEVQIDIVRYVNYADELSNSDHIAGRLKTWFATRQACDFFAANGYDLVNEWSDLITDGNYDDKKKWAQRSFFRVKFYVENNVSGTDTPLENIEIETKSI